MSLGLLLTLLLTSLIIAAMVLFLAEVPAIRPLAATAPPAKPALDERDLLDTDPREWVRRAEHAVEFEEGDKMDHMESFMQIQRNIAQRVDDRRLRDPAPRFTCVICGVHDTGHTHNMEAQ